MSTELIDSLLTDEIQNTVELSASAIRQIKKIQEDDSVPAGHYLRVGVKGGGCSGMSYTLGFDEKKETDIILNFDSVEVLVDKRHLLYLGGTVVDFKEGLDNRGFTFENPKATSTCGCGSSFSA